MAFRPSLEYREMRFSACSPALHGRRRSFRQNLPASGHALRGFARFVVNPSMTPSRGSAPCDGFSAPDQAAASAATSRHAKCIGEGSWKKVSHSSLERVNFSLACSTQDLSRQGIHSNHGHFGRSLVGVRFPVVSSPGCEAFFPQGQFFRGPGAGAALTTFVASPMSALMKRPAWATRPRRNLSIRATVFPQRPRSVRRPETAHLSLPRARVCDG